MVEKLKEKPSKQISGFGIRNKLLFWLLLVALVPMFFTGAVGYKIASGSLEKQSFASMESTLDLQKKALEDYLSERTRNIRDLAEEISILQQEQFLKLAGVKKLKKKLVEEYFQVSIVLTRTFAASPIHKKALAEFKESTSKARKSFHSFFLKFLKIRDFSAMLYLDRSGKVLYSSDKSVKPGTSIRRYPDTPEAEAYGKALKGKSGFVDFKRSSLQNEEATAYFFAPIKKDKTTAGVVLLRMKNTSLDSIMKENVGLGKSGETYLMGSDGMFRSNSVFFEESTIVNAAFIADTETVEKVLKGKSGQEIIINYRGEYVLSSYVPVKVSGMTWALVVQIDQTETVAPRLKGHESDLLKGYAENNGYPDLYMIDTDGYIFYSAKHLPDYQTNILSGPYSGSLLADTFADAIESKEMVLTDYSRYQPAGDQPTAFLALPIEHDGQVYNVLVLQIPIDHISSIMKKHGGLGETADSYLVGPDKLWRSESLQLEKYNVKSTLLNPKVPVDTKAVREALSGNSGTGITKNSAGEKVLSSWKPLVFHGLQWAIINEVNKKEIERPSVRLFRISTFVAAIAIALVLLVSFLVSGGITRQIKAIMNVMSKVEKGDLDSRAKVISNDELGKMASSFNGMIKTTKSLMDTRQAEHDQLQESIIGLLEEISALADGDMTVRATVREDATGTVADSLNLMLEELSLAIGNIKKYSEQVGATAKKMSSSTTALSIRSDDQSQLIGDTVEEIHKMTQTIKQAAKKANQSAETSKLSRTAAIEGARTVEDTSRAMEAIRRNVQDTARAIKRLGESSQEISDFTRTINSISDRTSILALNASIQASAAGEEGRGFAVIAEEIQRLSDQAAGSTRQIETLIKNILGEITEASASMDASIQEVVNGTTLSENALDKLKDINTRSSEVAELIGAVSLATEEQAESSAKVARTMGDIGVISEETAKETRKTSSSMRDMAVVASKMLQSVAAFKLEEEDQANGQSDGLNDLVDESNVSADGLQPKVDIDH